MRNSRREDLLRLIQKNRPKQLLLPTPMGTMSRERLRHEIPKADTMKYSRTLRFALHSALLCSAAFAMAGAGQAQQIPEQLFSEMKWRVIGPFRAGKGNAVAGIPGNPAVFYFGADGGGVWKTTD